MSISWREKKHFYVNQEILGDVVTCYDALPFDHGDLKALALKNMCQKQLEANLNCIHIYMKHLALDIYNVWTRRLGSPSSLMPPSAMLLIKCSGLRFKAAALTLQILNTNVITIILY